MPFPDAPSTRPSTCAVLQHLATPVLSLTEIRRVLKRVACSGGGRLVDGHHPLSDEPLLEKWDRLRVLEREHNLGQPAEMLRPRALARGRLHAHASLGLADDGIRLPAGTLEETRRVAQNLLIRLRACSARSRSSRLDDEGRARADRRRAHRWGDRPNAFYARPRSGRSVV